VLEDSKAKIGEQGKNWRESGIYKQVFEHFEPVFNEASPTHGIS